MKAKQISVGKEVLHVVGYLALIYDVEMLLLEILVDGDVVEFHKSNKCID